MKGVKIKWSTLEETLIRYFVISLRMQFAVCSLHGREEKSEKKVKIQILLIYILVNHEPKNSFNSIEFVISIYYSDKYIFC
jgi:hypothetical protein